MKKNKNGLDNGKCIDCGACGHSGCCPPTDCKMTNNCSYCIQYLNELKNTEVAYKSLYDLISKNIEKLPEEIVDAFEDIIELKCNMNTAISWPPEWVEKYPWLRANEDVNFDDK
jgi:hypothetical protein